MQNEQYREMMTVGNVDQLMALFGPHDENVDLVRRETGAEIFAHGDEITLSGEEEAVRLAHLVLDKLLAILAQGEGIDRSRIRYAIDLAREGNADRIEEIMQRRDRHHLPRPSDQVQDPGSAEVHRRDQEEHLRLRASARPAPARPTWPSPWRSWRSRTRTSSASSSPARRSRRAKSWAFCPATCSRRSTRTCGRCTTRSTT